MTYLKLEALAGPDYDVMTYLKLEALAGPDRSTGRYSLILNGYFPSHIPFSKSVSLKLFII